MRRFSSSVMVEVEFLADRSAARASILVLRYSMLVFSFERPVTDP